MLFTWLFYEHIISFIQYSIFRYSKSVFHFLKPKSHNLWMTDKNIIPHAILNSLFFIWHKIAQNSIYWRDMCVVLKCLFRIWVVSIPLLCLTLKKGYFKKHRGKEKSFYNNKVKPIETVSIRTRFNYMRLLYISLYPRYLKNY